MTTNQHLLQECFCPLFSRNRASYVDMICKLFPTLLHSLYRYATSVLGCSANTKALVEVMNQKAKQEYPLCPIRSNLSFNSYHFWKFFKNFGGRLIRHSTKPRLSEEQKQQRVEWACQMKHEIYSHIDDDNFHYCFIDKKWFFTTSARNRMKILPQANFESKEDAEVQVPRLRNRRFPAKVMTMSVISKPYPEYLFDGKIFTKRVAETYVTNKHSYNQNLSNYYEINHALKRGEWKCNFVPYADNQNMLVLDVLQVIVELYDLKLKNELVFSYKTHTSTGRSYKWKRLRCEDGYLLKGRKITTNRGITRPLKFDDLILHQNIHPGSIVMRDTTCDSSFMLNTIEEIGTAIRNSFHWVNINVPIHLIMDNAGGHGTNQTKET